MIPSKLLKRQRIKVLKNNLFATMIIGHGLSINEWNGVTNL